jgi:hypothetical protein
MSAPVRRDQFEISPKVITHKPTGQASFRIRASQAGDASIRASSEMCFRMVMTMSRTKWMR